MHLDADANFSYYNVRASDDFPMFSLSCISANALPYDLLHLNRLTKQQIEAVERIEIRVDRKPAMTFLPGEHNIEVGFKLTSQLDEGVETVTLMPINDAGKNQYASMVRQFVAGNNASVSLITPNGSINVSVSLAGFTKAYRPLQKACADPASDLVTVQAAQ